MQDRFKFRGLTKGKEPNKWIYGSLLWYADEPQIWDGEGNNYLVRSETVGQCTGLKDKNGKLIYEGDILKGKKDMICSPRSSRTVDKVGVVEIPQNMFVASCRDVKNNCTLFCQNDWHKTEVIGNIYENPELISGAE